MFDDVEKDNDAPKTGDKNRRRLFWILVMGIFAAVVVIWLSFFSGTIFRVNTSAPISSLQNIGGYWNNMKSSFSKAFNLLTSTTTATTTEDQATSTQ